VTGAVVVPISLATTFSQKRPGETYGRDQENAYNKGWEYSRTGDALKS